MSVSRKMKMHIVGSNNVGLSGRDVEFLTCHFPTSTLELIVSIMGANGVLQPPFPFVSITINGVTCINWFNKLLLRLAGN